MAPTKKASKTKRTKLDFGGTSITVLVGKKEKPFIVHEGIITNHSEFFRAACSGQFRESRERTVRLPSVEVDVFENFLHWLYTSEVLVMNEKDIDEDEREKGLSRYAGLAELYATAEFLGARDLRNKVIDAFIALKPTVLAWPSVRCICTVYDDLMPGAKLRQLVLDMYVSCPEPGSASWLRENRQDLPHEFIFDFAVGKAQMHEGDGPEIDVTKSCNYHEHIDGATECN